MSKFKLTAMAAVLACVLCAGLVACSSSGSGSSAAASGSGSAAASVSAASASSAAPTKSDEQLIKESIEFILGTEVSKDELLTQLRADPAMVQFEQNGLNLEEYAANMANKIKLEVGDIKVNGDTAVATVNLLVPSFSTEAEQMLTNEIMKEIEGKDVSSMSEDDVAQLTLSVLSRVLADPDFPTATTTLDINYAKSNGTWQMQDMDTIMNRLSAAMNMAAGLEE